MDRRGICETEFWGAVLFITVLVFLPVASVWFGPWTWGWAISLITAVCTGWLCVVQYGKARVRARRRRDEAVRAKFLALNPEERAHVNKLAGLGEICLSGDDAEDQIDWALRRHF